MKISFFKNHLSYWQSVYEAVSNGYIFFNLRRSCNGKSTTHHFGWLLLAPTDIVVFPASRIPSGFPSFDVLPQQQIFTSMCPGPDTQTVDTGHCCSWSHYVCVSTSNVYRAHGGISHFLGWTSRTRTIFRTIR